MNRDHADRSSSATRSRAPGGLVEEQLTRRVLGAFFEVYNELGFGFLESVYQEALARVLAMRGARVEREVSLAVRFRGEVVGWFRADLIVDGRVIVEVKAVSALAQAHVAQLGNYLRATGLQVGLVLNFGPKPEFRRSVFTGRAPIRGTPPDPSDQRPPRPGRDRDCDPGCAARGHRGGAPHRAPGS